MSVITSQLIKVVPADLEKISIFLNSKCNSQLSTMANTAHTKIHVNTNNFSKIYVNCENCLNTTTNSSSFGEKSTPRYMAIIQCVIASLGIIGNSTVIVVFLNHRKFRRKIPNIFIINQVG